MIKKIIYNIFIMCFPTLLFVGGLITWLSTHTHPVPALGTSLPSLTPTPSNPGSITGKITKGSTQVNIGDSK
jgi:hypothetical protein